MRPVSRPALLPSKDVIFFFFFFLPPEWERRAPPPPFLGKFSLFFSGQFLFSLLGSRVQPLFSLLLFRVSRELEIQLLGRFFSLEEVFYSPFSLVEENRAVAGPILFFFFSFLFLFSS